LGLLVVGAVAGRAGATGAALASLGVEVSAVSAELVPDWSLPAEVAGPLAAGPQPDSSVMAASTAVSDLIVLFIGFPQFGSSMPVGMRGEPPEYGPERFTAAGKRERSIPE
jgi:hypothetical protein